MTFMKKSTAIPALLVLYLAIMSAIGLPNLLNGHLLPIYYFGLIIATLIAIFYLRRNLLAREKKRINRHYN